jgi:hypothetical protein
MAAYQNWKSFGAFYGGELPKPEQVKDSAHTAAFQYGNLIGKRRYFAKKLSFSSHHPAFSYPRGCIQKIFIGNILLSYHYIFIKQ